MSKSIITKATLFIVFLFSTIFLKTTAQNTFVYPTVKIKNTEWGTENIRITKFKNGEPIPLAKTKKDWVDAAIAKKPIYEIEIIENKPVYRYNFYVFMDKRGVIPNGFSLPTEKDIDDLALNLSENTSLIPKLKILPIGSKSFNRNKSTISFDPSTVGFWVLDESSSDMLTYDMGTSKVLFVNNDCLNKFPAMCDGSFDRFETLYEAGGSDAGNGFCVRLIKKK
jgi:uncharacterized protein (TIGR02145 family)